MYTKFAKFARLYFLQFTTFHNQTSQFRRNRMRVESERVESDTKQKIFTENNSKTTAKAVKLHHLQ